jgi:SAM-dependent methyltransferase
MPDAVFAEPRLAEVYDPLDPDRSDLDAYLSMADEFDARSVLDLGCGTGTFACLLAERDKVVTGIDPAAASVEVARRKRFAERVRWLDAGSLPAVQVDLVTMTGNVAQVFLTDDDWTANLLAVRSSLRPGGRLVFETRDPAKRAWLRWTREQTFVRVEIPHVGAVQSWEDLTEVDLPLVSFRSTVLFEADGATLTSDSTLRFRSREEISSSLQEAGFLVQDVRDAPDRPGLEFVFVARPALSAD